jgi:hypothetical protein
VVSISFWVAFAVVFSIVKICGDAGLSTMASLRVRRVSPATHDETAEDPAAENASAEVFHEAA